MSTQGDVSAAGMTSSLTSAVIDASASIASFAITGGAGNDVITVGNLKNTVTPGQGVDSITLEASGASATSLSTVVFNVGDSNPVADGAANDDTGQDSIYHIDAAGADTIVVRGVSTDTTWSIADHVVMGTGNGGGAESSDAGNAAAYNDVAALVQFGNDSSVSDAFDIVFNAYSDGSTALADNATLQANIAVDITGTIGNDTITTGVNADTISGGAGDDTINGNEAGDIIDGGAGNDIIDINDANDSAPDAYSQTTLDGIDVITLGTGDTIDLADFNSGAIADATNDDVVTVTFATGAAETTWTAIMTAVNSALSNDVNDVNIIRVVDNSTDTSLDGSLSGYYLIANDGSGAAFGEAADVIIKLVGVDTGTTWAVSSGDIVSFTL